MPLTSSRNSLLYILTILLFGLSLSFIFNKSLRTKIYNLYQKPHREVLSVVIGNLTPSGIPIKVIKVKTEKGLYLEFYDTSKNTSRPLMEKILLPQPYDGFFNFKEKPTNLFITDVDKDGQLEVVAPSFDKNLSAFIHVYKYNKDVQRFEKIQIDP